MKYLSDYTQDNQTVLFNSTGAFFAFGQQQFNDAKKEGVKYVNCGSGLICPKTNVDQLINGLDTIQEQAIKQDIAENGAKKIIEREYFNHESQISDATDAFNALSIYNFDETLITKVFKDCFKLAVKNDWF